MRSMRCWRRICRTQTKTCTMITTSSTLSLGSPSITGSLPKLGNSKTECFKRMKVYEKVPRWRAREAGCNVVTTRWIYINKCDVALPNYRARLAGREKQLEARPLRSDNATRAIEVYLFVMCKQSKPARPFQNIKYRH